MEDVLGTQMNEDFEPDDDAEEIIRVMKEEGDRVNPLLLREETGIQKQYVHNSLERLIAAGWVRKINRGLYEFVGDPREE